MSNRSRSFRLGHLTINLVEGDIAAIKADALLTAINSGGAWFGGIDGVIQRAAGQMFHNQASRALPLKHSNTVVAKKQGAHRGQFEDVVFVIDDLEGPLNAIIISALTAASKAGYKKISLPAIRTGVMLGAVEKNTEETAYQTVIGFETFAATHTGSLTEATLVVYNQPDIFNALVFDLERTQTTPAVQDA